MAKLYCFLPFLAVCLALTHGAEGKEYIVGGRKGWTLPSRSGVNYTEWASQITFHVGDTLVFNYAYKAHNVLEVTRTDFRYCNASNPKVHHADKSNTTVVTLANPGSHYFIDGVGDHCSLGQKFEIRVLGAVSAVSPVPASASQERSRAIPPATATAAPSLQRSVAEMCAALALVAIFTLRSS